MYLLLTLKSHKTGRSEILQLLPQNGLYRIIGQWDWGKQVAILYPGIAMSKLDIERLYLYLNKWVSDY
jgi:hypothetical protein